MLEISEKAFHHSIVIRIAFGRKRLNHIVLSVTDYGIGIPADRQKQIFERFYRGESARSSEGTGLGLAMVKEIAEYHGGSVSVVSEEGNGSAFSVNF